MSGFKILGVNDDQNFCQCCGKSDLKAVVWIQNLETGEVQHFGSVCATKPAKAFGITKTDIAKKIKEQEKAEAEKAKKEARVAFEAAQAKANELRVKTDNAYLAQGGSFNPYSGEARNRTLWQKINDELKAA
jgi:hypothetical protein